MANSRICSIAAGSASELEYHLLLAKDLELINTSQHKAHAGSAPPKAES